MSGFPVSVGGSDSQSPAVFWLCRPSGTLQVSQAEFQSDGRGLPRGVLSDPWHRSCWHRTHPASCSGLWQWREGEQPAMSWLQEALNQQTCKLLCTFFPMSSTYLQPCVVALTGITITMWVLWVWSCIREGFVGKTLQWWCWKHAGMVLNGVIQMWGRCSHPQSCVHCLESDKVRVWREYLASKGHHLVTLWFSDNKAYMGISAVSSVECKKAENGSSPRQSIMPSCVSKHTAAQAETDDALNPNPG